MNYLFESDGATHYTTAPTDLANMKNVAFIQFDLELQQFRPVDKFINRLIDCWDHRLIKESLQTLA